MVSAEKAIANLLGTYAEAMDGGRLEDAAALFAHAQIKRARPRDEVLDAAGLLSMWREWIIMYPDGTPRTKHVVTNTIIQTDEQHGIASSRSYYTVLQQTDDFPLQIVCAGRYHDEYEFAEDKWRFSSRDYSMLDLIGDMSRHLRPQGLVGVRQDIDKTTPTH